MKPSEEIRATKELLMEKQWVQGDYVAELWDDENDMEAVGYCLVGAYGQVAHNEARTYASGFDYSFADVSHPLRCMVDATEPKDIHCDTVERWNDAPGRTFQEVCDLLDKAEKLALIREEGVV